MKSCRGPLEVVRQLLYNCLCSPRNCICNRLTIEANSCDSNGLDLSAGGENQKNLYITKILMWW